jgi:hypothetical protein
LIASQLTGIYSNPGGTTVETRNITAGTYTFNITDSAGDGICCDFGSGLFKITVDGETVTVINNNGNFLFSAQQTFNVISSELEVTNDCSDLLSGCSMVRYFGNRTREVHVSMAYFVVTVTMIEVM